MPHLKYCTLAGQPGVARAFALRTEVCCFAPLAPLSFFASWPLNPENANFLSRVLHCQIRPWPPSLSRFAISNNLSIKETLQCRVACSMILFPSPPRSCQIAQLVRTFGLSLSSVYRLLSSMFSRYLSYWQIVAIVRV